MRILAKMCKVIKVCHITLKSLVTTESQLNHPKSVVKKILQMQDTNRGLFRRINKFT